MITIVIANQKGGVGKTTTAVTLAHGLALQGKGVLLVDLDPQGQVSTFLGLPQESGVFDLLVTRQPLAAVIRSTAIPDHDRNGLLVIPGNSRTATAQIVLAAEGFKLDCLARALGAVRTDYIIFDTSPSVGLLQEAALYAADWLIAPCAVDYAATEGLTGVLTTLQAVKEQASNCQLLAVLPTFYDELTRESATTLRQLTYSLGDAVWEPIHRATILRECAAEGLTVFEKAPCRATQEYAVVVEKVLSYET